MARAASGNSLPTFSKFSFTYCSIIFIIAKMFGRSATGFGPVEGFGWIEHPVKSLFTSPLSHSGQDTNCLSIWLEKDS